LYDIGTGDSYHNDDEYKHEELNIKKKTGTLWNFNATATITSLYAQLLYHAMMSNTCN